MAGHFDVTTVAYFVDNGTEVLLRGRDWDEEEMPKQSSSTIGQYLKYGAETKCKGVLKVTKINPLSVRGDVVYPIGDVKKGKNVTIEYTSTYKTVRIDLIDVDAEANTKQETSPGTSKNPVLIDGNEDVPSQPALTPIAITAVATTADTPVEVPPPDAPTPEHLRALEQAASDTETRWREARIENSSNWKKSDAILNTVHHATVAYKKARDNPSQPNELMKNITEELKQAAFKAKDRWLSAKIYAKKRRRRLDGLFDAATAAREARDSGREELRVVTEHARNATTERGEVEEPVVNRRSRAREIASATQRGIDTRLSLYREYDQAAQESVQGAIDTLRQPPTPPQADTTLSLYRDLYHEYNRTAQESVQGATDTPRQPPIPPQAEATTSRSEERVRLLRARDQAERNQTFEQRLLGEGTPEGRAYDRFRQEQNIAIPRAETAEKFREQLARKPVKGEKSNKTSKTMAKCPYCDKLTSSRDRQALRRDIDDNSDSVCFSCPICYTERQSKMLYRCCGYVNASCLGCAQRCKFAEPDRHFEPWEM